MAKQNGDFYHYGGAIHIHTTESDGTRTIEEVVELGQQVGLDFMLFSDHMTLSNQENGKEGFYDKTLVLVGYEHNDLDDKHHYLLFNSPKVYDSTIEVAEFVAAGAEDKAIGFMAHPDEIRTRLSEYPPYPWIDWDVKGYTGIELWNQMSEWIEKLRKYNKLIMLFSPRRSIVAPTERILKKWDEVNIERKVAGIAGVDAHAFPIKAGPITVEIFPYKVHFKTLRTYIILPEPMSDDFKTARKQIYNAFRNCNLYFANVRGGDAENFEFYALSNSTKVSSGGSINIESEVTLQVKLPSKATIRIIHNGKKIVETYSNILQYKTCESGIYRVEAWQGKRGWIFSNHIRVGV